MRYSSFILALILPFTLAITMSLVIFVNGDMCGAMTQAEAGDDRAALMTKAFANFRSTCRKGQVRAVFSECHDTNIFGTDAFTFPIVPMVNFTIPNATDYYTGKPLTVSCSPMPGTEFTKNITVVNCTASNAEGHVSSQVCYFNVQLKACRDPLGMESGAIPDSSLSVSSAYSIFPKEESRLNAGAWSPVSDDRNQWIRVDLEESVTVTGIITQGVTNWDWTTSYKVKYSDNGADWIYVTGAQGAQVESVILPVHNAESWLDDCLQSVLNQHSAATLELSTFMDACTDKSCEILASWKPKLEAAGILVEIGGHSDDKPKGVGYAKNQAISQSHGKFLCFLDADDVMDSHRIEMQLAATVDRPYTITGCQFNRLPAGSTGRYTRWANTISQEQLMTQIYTAHGPTIIMPTWFCSRDTFNRVGAFDESGKGTPEDLRFFFEHLRLGGSLYRVNQCLLMYRYHPNAATHSVSQESIWDIRMKALDERVLSNWDSFTIWNAGKQGRRFYRSLRSCNQNKVIQFCDVDPKKIKKGVYIYEESKTVPKPRVPIIHFREAKPPFIICVKMDLTDGHFESNLKSLNLTEGKDYVLFS